MSKIELPPEPEPTAHVTKVAEGRILFLPRPSLDAEGMVALFTADQLRARDRQIVKLCARVCDRVRAKSAVSYETGAACAAAILNLIEESNNG
jgi:hypothetical protein